MCWRYLSSRAVTRQVLSAQTSLTSVFGMGTGGPSQQSTPTIQFGRLSPSNFYILTHIFRFVKNFFQKIMIFLWVQDAPTNIQSSHQLKDISPPFTKTSTDFVSSKISTDFSPEMVRHTPFPSRLRKVRRSPSCMT